MDEQDELLLDVLNQACGNGEGEIDNQCLSAYEDACDYLKKKGILEEINSRIYNIVEGNELIDLKICDGRIMEKPSTTKQVVKWLKSEPKKKTKTLAILPLFAGIIFILVGGVLILSFNFLNVIYGIISIFFGSSPIIIGIGKQESS